MTSTPASSGRPAAQVRALHAAAMFLQHAAAAGLAAGSGLEVAVDPGAFITIPLPRGHGDLACRETLITALASAAGGGYVVRFISLGCRDRYGVAGYGHLAGHPVTFTTPNAETR